MIAAIRIRGIVGVDTATKETLHRLRLRRKFACVLIDEKDTVKIGMVKSVRNFVSYGKITKETEKQLIELRGQKKENGKLKEFFRLHPPRGGANMKLHFPRGLLGENKEMDKLIGRML